MWLWARTSSATAGSRSRPCTRHTPHAHARPHAAPQGAERPREEEFSETPVGADEDDVPDYLKGVPKDAKVMVRRLSLPPSSVTHTAP